MRVRLAAGAIAAAAAITVSLATAPAAHGRISTATNLTTHQRAVLHNIAKDTWRFFENDVDPGTHLPLDNVGPGTTRGAYTSSANIGVYLWSVVAAHDLHLISRGEADARVRSTLREVQQLQRSHGFLFQWYDTSTGHVILNPGQGDCPQVGGTTDNCSFLSAVDNGWYASGLVVVRQALPDVAGWPADCCTRPTSRSSTTPDRRPTATSMPTSRASPPVRCTAASTPASARPRTTTARSTATRASRCTSAWVGTRCRATCGGAPGGCFPRRAAPATRTSPGRASRRAPAPATGPPSPTRCPASSSRSGRAITPTRAPR